MSNYILYEVIGGILLLIIAIFFTWRQVNRRKKRKLQANVVPEQILLDFEEAERRFKLDNKNGNGNPYKILYDIWRERTSTVAERESGTTNDSQSISNGGVSEQSTKVQSIPNGKNGQDNSRTKQSDRRIQRIEYI